MTKEQIKRRREIFLTVCVFIVLAVLAGVQFRLGGLSQELPLTSSIVFFGIINLNVILFTLLIFLIARNLTKVFLERKKNKSKLQSKLVFGFIGFGIIPTLILFFIAAVYVNNSFDKWFSIRVANTLQMSLDMTKSFYTKIQNDLVNFSQTFANSNDVKDRYKNYNVSFAASISDPFEIPFVYGNNSYYQRPTVEDYQKLMDGEVIVHTSNLPNADTFQLLRMMPSGEVLSLGQVLESPEPDRIGKITNTLLDYDRVNPLKYPIKSIYLVLLITMTLTIIFVSVWAGVYLSKQWTNPLNQLIHGIRFVSQGHYDIRIPNFARDEIGLVIDTFNNMANSIAENERSKESQKQTLESIISSITNAIIVFNADGSLYIKNNSANFPIGPKLKDFLINIQDFNNLYELPDIPGVWQVDRAALPENRILFSLEERSGELKEQRELAWREVARRIAHEIKNPLTPIKLTAERLGRKYKHHFVGRDRAIFEESTQIIIDQTNMLRNMVNEFSQFAKLPTLEFKKHDIIQVVTGIINLYKQSYPQFSFKFIYDENVPDFAFDEAGIKRVIINLIENAKDASLIRKDPAIQVRLHYNNQINRIRIEVEDNGKGIPESELRRIFEPYFSTKPKGSGLGLAIGERIALDHEGRLTATSDGHTYSIFVLELPTTLRESIACQESSSSKTNQPSDDPSETP